MMILRNIEIVVISLDSMYVHSFHKSDSSLGKNGVIFGVDASSVHIDTKEKDI